jgi:hypothetical protein
MGKLTGEFDKKLCEHSLGLNHPKSFHKAPITIAEMMCIEILCRFNQAGRMP